MSERKESDRLFDEFPPTPTAEWEEQIREDLSGADYAETLLWRWPDGLTVRPYYRSEDRKSLEHLDSSHPETQVEARWTLQQNVKAGSVGTAADQVKAAIEGGVERVGLQARPTEGTGQDGVPIETADNLAKVLEEVSLGEIGVHLDAGLESRALFRWLVDVAQSRSIQSDDLRGSLGFDALSPTHEQDEAGALGQAADLISEAGESALHVRLLQVNANLYHESGATIVQETALAMAAMSEYLVQLVERSLHARDVLRRLYLSISVSTSFFPEIAKLRALRLLVPQVVRAFLPEESNYQIPIHAQTSRRSLTLYDPHTNLLRATTQAASAVIGGCDVLVVHPFDDLNGQPSTFGMRLARSIQHLLRYEANLDKVDDPAGGSYYVEILTDAIARQAWTEFKNIEKMGGLLHALASGYVQEQLAESRRRIVGDVASGRRVLVGTNRYADPSERRLEDAEPGADAGSHPEFKTFREPEVIESLRLDTERRKEHPKILILPIGKPSTRRERSNFASDLLACGGLSTEVRMGYDTVEDALAEVGASADVLILAASDELYSHEVVQEVRNAFDPVLFGIVASDNVLLEVDFVLSRSVGVVGSLRMLKDQIESTEARVDEQKSNP